MKKKGFTLIELLVVIAIIGILMSILLPMVSQGRSKAKLLKCKANLRSIGTALQSYISTHGNERFFPYPTGASIGAGGEGDYNLTGAQFLAALYWSGTMANPSIFICPASQDSNDEGEKLGDEPQEIEPGAISYASRGTTKTPSEEWPLVDDFARNTAMACDDSEGKRNHKGIAVLFIDGHVEYFPDLNPNDFEQDSESAVGRTKPVDMLEN